MCEAADPLDRLSRIANEVLALPHAVKPGEQGHTLLKHAVKNIHHELRNIAARLENERNQPEQRQK